MEARCGVLGVHAAAACSCSCILVMPRIVILGFLGSVVGMI